MYMYCLLLNIHVHVGAPEEVFACLNQLGYKEFRAGQEAAVLQILSGILIIIYLISHYNHGAPPLYHYQVSLPYWSSQQALVSLSVTSYPPTAMPSVPPAASLW